MRSPTTSRGYDPRDYEYEHSRGGMRRQAFEDDPKHLCFHLARYKHTAKLLAGCTNVLEVGCADGFGTRIVRQHVEALTAIDTDERSIQEARLASSARWPVMFERGDICDVLPAHSALIMPVKPLWQGFDAVYALDVLEHISPDEGFLRAMCAAAPVAVIGTPSKESQVHASRLSLLGHVNCMLPGAVVEGVVVGALKSFYAGPVTEIITSKGNRLSLTLNHPVMTTQGWVSAGTLCEGMELIRNKDDVGGLSDNNQQPALIEDVFASIKLSGAYGSITPSVEDLHGDARFIDSDIDIVFVDRSLLVYSPSTQAQGMSDFAFKVADVRESLVASLGARQLGCQRIPLATSGVLRLGDLLSYVGCRSFAESDKRCFGESAHWHTVPLQKRSNGGIVDSVFLSELKCRSAGQIEVDQVVGLRRFEYVGHVYDLQTVQGYHTANGLYISNCYSGTDLRARLLEYWDHVFVFTMHDEILGTSYYPMAQYLLALCIRN